MSEFGHPDLKTHRGAHNRFEGVEPVVTPVDDGYRYPEHNWSAHVPTVPQRTPDNDAINQLLLNRIMDVEYRIHTLETRSDAHRNRLDTLSRPPRSRNKLIIAYLGELVLYGAMVLLLVWLSRYV